MFDRLGAGYAPTPSGSGSTLPCWGWLAGIDRRRIGLSFARCCRRCPVKGQRAIADANAYNRSDFRSTIKAQAACLACGGPGNDLHRLDEDRDGLACEGLALLP